MWSAGEDAAPQIDREPTAIGVQDDIEVLPFEALASNTVLLIHQ